MPRIKSKLKLLLPITLPKAAELYPFMDEVMLTSSSGVEVPSATTVSPMAIFEILNFFAIEEEPLTKKSAPFMSIANPTSNKITGKSIGIRRVEFRVR